jgi:hypothetical protein
VIVMPLFGPSIEKMKEKGDIDGLVRALSNAKVRSEAIKALVELKSKEGLIKALHSSDPEVRIEVAETLKDIGDPFALEVLNKAIINTLKFGKTEEQVEVITLIQGRAPEGFLEQFLLGVFHADSKRVQALKKIKRKMNPEIFRDALLEVVEQGMLGVAWYALVALVELGDRHNKILHKLIEVGNLFLEELDQMRQEGSDEAIISFIWGMAVHEETLRALSYFRGNDIAADVIIKAYKGELLKRPGTIGTSRKAIYALAALGGPSAKEFLEYLVARGEVPKIALELCGKATYDEIKAQMESYGKK